MKKGSAIPSIHRVAILVESQVSPRRRMLTGIARYMQEHQPWAIYLKPWGVSKSFREWLNEWEGDGIITAIVEHEEGLFDNLDIPVVDLIGTYQYKGIPLVHTNDREVGNLGAIHLVERGLKSFGFLGYSNQQWSYLRKDGFFTTVQAAGGKCCVHEICFPLDVPGGPVVWEQQQKELGDWIAGLSKPAGVMCATDFLAQQFMEACLRAQIRIPDEIAVIGADNDEPICQLCWPPLSSVIINDDLRGYMAASVLDKLMQGEPPPVNPILIDPPGIFSRGSTDLLAVDDPHVVTALRYIRTHATRGIDVEDVVRQVPLSRSVLEKRFRKITQRSLHSEILRVRINTAIRLLTETDLPIKAIAHRSGFGSTSHMSARFREKLGRSPSSFRPDRSHIPPGNIDVTATDN